MEELTILAVDADLVAPRFAVLIADGECWKCGEATPMAGVWVPSYTEIDREEGEEDTVNDAALLHYVGGVTAAVSKQLNQIAPWLRYACTAGAGTTYLANHCAHCDTVQGDWFVFGVDGPLFPQTDEEIERIRFVPAEGPFHGRGDPSMSSWMSMVERQPAGGVAGG